MNFEAARQNMVAQQVRPLSVNEEGILTVLGDLQREIFVPPQYAHLAYCDTDIPLMEGQTMLPPKTVGKALQSLKIMPEDAVLEIGTGTGYVTACLGRLAKQVTSIEILEPLLTTAERNLKGARELSNIVLVQDDGVFGYEPQAPYDVIFVTGSYPLGVPGKLCEQVKVGGRIFAIIGQPPVMKAILMTRTKEHWTTQYLFETVVPPLFHAPQPQSFEF